MPAALEKKFSIPKFSQIEWKPLNFIDVDDESNARTLLKLLETLEELDDVQNVASNFNINDSLMENNLTNLILGFDPGLNATGLGY